MEINESYVIKKYQQNHSTYSIAKELNTYPKKIERILKKHGHKLRNKSEAQSLALESGRSKHPTQGIPRTEEQKIKISKAVEKRWHNMPPEDKQKFILQAQQRWKKMSPNKKREMLEKAGRALRQTAVEGSKAEKSLKKNLTKAGYHAILHKKNLVEGNFEIDLFLPEINTIIEIDGPQHFLPIFGEERLQDVTKFDAIKNGLLISKGYCVIRVRYLCKHISQSVERKLWTLVSEQVEKIRKKFPPKGKRFIELEISNE